MLKEQKSLARKQRKTEKLKRKDEKYFKKYGVHLNEVQDKNEKVKIKYLWKFLPFFRGSPALLICIIIFFLLTTALSIATPFILSYVTDTAVSGNLYTALIWAIIYGVAETVMSIIVYFQYYFYTKFFNKTTHKIRISLIKDTAETKISKLNDVKSGEILSRINYDPENFSNSFVTLIDTFRWLIRRVGRLGIAFIFSWKLGVFALGAGFIIFIINKIYLKKKLRQNEILDKQINDKYNSQSAEMVRGIRDIKNLNIFSHFYEKFTKLSVFRKNTQTNLSNSRDFSNIILSDGLVFFFGIGLYALATMLVISGEISIGNLTTILLYNYDMLSVFGLLGQMNNNVQSMEISAKRMYELKDEKQYPKEVFGKSELTHPEGNIRFKNVSFSYEDEKVFDNLTFEIKAGQSVGIVGRSGEGKSTILNLIPRIYDVDSGSVEIDDIDVRELTQDSLRNTVSMVSQSPYIFDLTIEENLRLVKPDATDAELEDVCKKAQILDFIQSKPDGFKTRIGEGGVVLSGGQKQRLALARAFLKNSKILLLDEATSALDNNSQALVKEAIYNLQDSCTLVIVAHRLSTVIDCDKILVLNNHKLIAQGTHKELFKNCEVYRKLYEQDDLS